jgi:hypothetical protein
MGDFDARSRPSSGKCDLVDNAEKWGSPEFHQRQLVRQEEAQQQGAQQQEAQDRQVNYDAWNGWADAKIIQFCDIYSDQLLEIIFTRMNDKIIKVKEAAHTEIEQLKSQVSELRGEMNLLRALLQGGSNVKEVRSGHVMELRKPDVA